MKDQIALKELTAAIYLSRLPGVGAAKFAELLKEHKLPSEALLFYNKNAQQCLSGQSLQKSSTKIHIENTLLALQKGDISGSYFSGAGYPGLLSDLSEPPPVLFYVPAKKPEWPKFATVVGTRSPDDRVERLVEKVVLNLLGRGFAILSGGATGVDEFAHRAALKCRGQTSVIFANGLDVVYPKKNAELFLQIKENGGFLLSELLCGALPQKSFFPTRNRLLAAMGELVVVVQAPEKSGALITAKWAKKLGRKLLVMPPADEGQRWQGNKQLLSQGAEAFSD
jgi:DNA processing protein